MKFDIWGDMQKHIISMELAQICHWYASKIPITITLSALGKS